MKNNILCASIALVCLLGSCAKDKKFDDQGLGLAEVEVKGVTFPQSKNLAIATTAKDSISIATDVNSLSTPQTNSSVVIALESINAAESDVRVNIIQKPTLIPTGYLAIPTGTYTIPTSVVIPAGKKYVNIPIVFNSTSAFSLTSSYAVALELTSSDGGYQISANRRQLIISFNVKNQYDGKYRLNGIMMLHPTYGGFRYTTDKVELRTAGANSVNQYCTIWDEYCQPFAVTASGSLNRFGDLAPQYVVNGDNTVAVPSAGGPGNLTPMVYGPGGISVNTYNPTTRTFYIQHGYLNAAGALRYWKDTLVYIGPR